MGRPAALVTRSRPAVYKWHKQVDVSAITPSLCEMIQKPHGQFVALVPDRPTSPCICCPGVMIPTPYIIASAQPRPGEYHSSEELPRKARRSIHHSVQHIALGGIGGGGGERKATVTPAIYGLVSTSSVIVRKIEGYPKLTKQLRYLHQLQVLW